MAARQRYEVIEANATPGTPANITAGGGTLTSSMVPCLGARAVTFIIYSTTGDTDVFAASGAFNLRYKVAGGTAIKEGSGALDGSIFGSLNGIAADGGAAITVAPASNNGVLAVEKLGCRLVGGANQIDSVRVYAIVWYE